MNSRRISNVARCSSTSKKNIMEATNLKKIFRFRRNHVSTPKQKRIRDHSSTTKTSERDESNGGSNESLELPTISFDDASCKDVDERSCLTDDLLSDDLSLRLPSSRSPPSGRIDYELPVFIRVDNWQDYDDDVTSKLSERPKMDDKKKRRSSYGKVDTTFFDEYNCTLSVSSEDMDDDDISWIGSYDFIKNDYSVVPEDMSL